jgi:hypothetical protein
MIVNVFNKTIIYNFIDQLFYFKQLNCIDI